MIGPDFLMFSKLIEIVFLVNLLVIFGQVILEQAFPFAPVGSLSAHHFWKP